MIKNKTKKLIMLTRFSIGSLGMTNKTERARLAKQIRQLRKNQQALWAIHGIPR